MLKLNNPNKIYIFSDPHYNHKNICRGTSSWDDLSRTRDFDTLDEMNKMIVGNLKKVPSDSTLICLGDWSFGGIESAINLRKALNYPVHLILGNHDHHIARNTCHIASLFESIYEQVLLCVDKHRILLYHYPIASWKDLASGVIHLYGHIHSNKGKILGPGKMMDVGMDGNDLKPWLLSDILDIMSTQPIKSLYEKDHHNEI